MHIIIDTREQAAYSFTGYDTRLTMAALPVGDYSLPGFQDRAAIERKSLDDLVSCLMGGNRERFERELAKARGYDLFAVVVEAALADVAHGRYRSDMRPHAALQSIIAFHARYGVPFLWAGNRVGGEYMTYHLLAKYMRELDLRFKQARPRKEKTPAATGGEVNNGDIKENMADAMPSQGPAASALP